MGTQELVAIADRGYDNGDEMVARGEILLQIVTKRRLAQIGSVRTVC